MKQIDERRFCAEENMTFVHKEKGTRMGNRIYIGNNDSIENYEEQPMTEDELLKLEEEKTYFEKMYNRLKR
jgi:hypothetical protein